MRLILLHIALLTLLSACKGPETILPPIMTVGHGGAGFDTYRNTVPPNSYAAVERGLLIEGADAVEIDIQLTTDSVLVLHHDGTLDASTHCSGCITELSSRELEACPLIFRDGPLGGQHPIPILDSILARYDDGKAVFFLNVKTNTYCPFADPAAFHARFARALSRLIQTQALHDRCFIETYDLDMLAACRSLDPAMRLIYDEDNFENALTRVQSLGYEGIGIVNETVNAEQVAKAKAAGIFTVIWGVRIASATQDAVDKAPDAIMTDDIRMLQNILAR